MPLVSIGAIGQLSLGPGDPWLVCLNLLVRSRSANAGLLVAMFTLDCFQVVSSVTLCCPLEILHKLTVYSV